MAFHLTKTMNPHLWHKIHQKDLIDKAVNESQQQMKDRFLEIIGEDDRTDQNVTNRKYYRNELRAELRKKIEAL